MLLKSMLDHPPWLKNSKNVIIFQIRPMDDVKGLLRSKVSIHIVKDEIIAQRNATKSQLSYVFWIPGSEVMASLSEGV